MPKAKGTKDLVPEIISLVMKKHADGIKNAQIARDLYLNKMTASAIIKRGGIKKKTGRKRKIDPTSERRILRTVEKDPRVYATELAADIAPVVNVSPQTVRNMLHRNRYRSRIARRKPLLRNREHRLARLRFAHKYLKMDLSFWRRVLFSDESKFFSFIGARRCVWRQPGTALEPTNVNSTVKFNGTSVMVWGCCTGSGAGPLIHITSRMTAKIYTDVLKQALPRAKRQLKLPRGWIFKHDNDPKHTAGHTKSGWRRMALSC